MVLCWAVDGRSGLAAFPLLAALSAETPVTREKMFKGAAAKLLIPPKSPEPEPPWREVVDGRCACGWPGKLEMRGWSRKGGTSTGLIGGAILGRGCQE